MAIYNFKCNKCGTTVTKSVASNDKVICKICNIPCSKVFGATFSNRPPSQNDVPSWFNDKVENINNFYRENLINTK